MSRCATVGVLRRDGEADALRHREIAVDAHYLPSRLASGPPEYRVDGRVRLNQAL